MTENKMLYILINEYHGDNSTTTEIMGVTDSKEKADWWMKNDHPSENIWHSVVEQELNVFGDWWK